MELKTYHKRPVSVQAAPFSDDLADGFDVLYSSGKPNPDGSFSTYKLKHSDMDVEHKVPYVTNKFGGRSYGGNRYMVVVHEDGTKEVVHEDKFNARYVAEDDYFASFLPSAG